MLMYLLTIYLTCVFIENGIALCPSIQVRLPFLIFFFIFRLCLVFENYLENKGNIKK